MRDFLVPKVHLGVKTICKKFQEVPTVGCDLLCVTVLTTPSKLLSRDGATSISSIVKKHQVLKLGDQVIGQ